MMAIYCSLEGCEEMAGCYQIVIPNPKNSFCEKCGRDVLPHTLTYDFCCMPHIIEWITRHHLEDHIAVDYQSSEG